MDHSIIGHYMWDLSDWSHKTKALPSSGAQDTLSCDGDED